MTASFENVQSTTNDDLQNLPPSPQAMADAVVAEAMAQQSCLTQPTQDDCTRTTNEQDTSSEQKSVLNESNRKYNENDANSELTKIMERDEEIPEKQKAITQFLSSTIESLVQKGLSAFHAYESAKRELSLAKEEINQKQRDVQRLRSCEETSQKTIAVNTESLSDDSVLHSFDLLYTLTMMILQLPFFRISFEQ
mmetsp:Transcript_5028/g.7716  ORF Transcript_5028/g.7716 Transcript_5028/m.7716 type:complete len:195 (+) Transcript_5028:65-649(+)